MPPACASLPQDAVRPKFPGSAGIFGAERTLHLPGLPGEDGHSRLRLVQRWRSPGSRWLLSSGSSILDSE